MTVVATIFALLIVVQGVLVAAAPQTVVAFVRSRIRSHVSIAIAASVIVRLLVGACFFFAGWVARWPDFIQWFGILMGLSAFGAIFVGKKRLERLVDRLESVPGWFLRIGGLAALTLGVLLVFGLQP